MVTSHTVKAPILQYFVPVCDRKQELRFTNDVSRRRGCVRQVLESDFANTNTTTKTNTNTNANTNSRTRTNTKGVLRGCV